LPATSSPTPILTFPVIPTITGNLFAVGSIFGKGNSTITGTSNQGVSALTLPVLPDKSYYQSLADESISPKGIYKLSGEINKIIFIDGDVMLKGDLSGTGTIIATGDIKVINAKNTDKLSLISYSDIKLDGSINFTALCYAAGSIKVDATGNFSGSLVADSIKIAGNTTLFYKPLLVEELLSKMEERFNEGDWESICEAAQVLMNYGTSATSYLTSIFQTKEKDPVFRKMIAEIIAETGDNSALPSLIQVLNDLNDNAYIRAEAAITLGEIGGTGAYEALVATLSDENAEVRSLAALGLGCLRDDRAVQPLLNLLSQDSSSRVRIRAIRALGDIKNREAEPSLIVLLSDEDRQVQGGAIIVLGEWKSQGAVPSLIKIAKEDGHINRYSAIKSLGKIGGDQAVTVLIELLQDESLSTIIDAAEALATIGDQRAVEPLIAAIQRIKESVTLKYLKEAYKKLTGQEYQE